MSKKKETSNISNPWNAEKDSTTGIKCPDCGNEGMDGTITGISAQFGLTRHCIKPNPETGKLCNRKWSGGVGVQQADFSHEPLFPTGRMQPYTPPEVQNLTPGFRDPLKNRDVDDE